MRLILAAFGGGIVGTSLRLGADLALPHGDTALPVGTLLVNVLGALLLGFLVGGLWTRPGTPNWVKVAAGPGLLGSFTTFSAVMVSVVGLGSAGLWSRAGVYLAASVLLGLLAAAAGLALSRPLRSRPEAPS
ncbi:MAG: CrcB family protein [Cryobacterium sp.]